MDVQIFVVSNQGEEDETRIDSVDLFGMQVMYVLPRPPYWSRSHPECCRGTRDVSGLKKTDDDD